MFYLLYVLVYAVTLFWIDKEYSTWVYIYFSAICGVATAIIYIGLYYIYNTKNDLIHWNTERDTILRMWFKSLLWNYHQQKLVEWEQLVRFSVNLALTVCLFMFIDPSIFWELYYFLIVIAVLNSFIDLNNLENDAIKKHMN